MSSAPPDVMENIVLRAGAGAGKTTELVRRVLSLAKSHKESTGKFPFLVVTTFTRKATQELKERLVQKALELNDSDLIGFVQSTSHLHISTIHGVLSIFLSRFGGLIGLPPQFTVISDSDGELQIKKIIRGLLRTDEEIKNKLNGLLETYSLRDLMEVFSQISEFDACGIHLRLADAQGLQSIAVTKLQNWAEQAQVLIEALIAEETSESWVKYRQGLESCVSSIQSASRSYEDKWNSLKSFDEYKPNVRKGKNSNPVTMDLKAELQKDLDQICDNWAYNPVSWVGFEEIGNQILAVGFKVSRLLRQKKLELGQITMGDLESYALYLIQQHPESAQLFSQEWSYWMIDEYQDTSPRQVQLFRSLMGDRKAFVVGDPQQSIYLFRGARSEVFHLREKEVQSQAGKLISKMDNHRSRPEVLEYFNDVFPGLSRQFGKMNPNRQKFPSADRTPAVLYLCGSSEEENYEVRQVVRRCQDLIQNNIPAEQICVLGRTHKDLDSVAELARVVGLPVQVHAPSSFYTRPEIQDCLCYLKFLVNPHDNINFVTLLRSPWFHLRDSEILRICSKAEKSYWAKALKEFVSEFSVIQKLNKNILDTLEIGIGRVWVSGLQESGLIETAHRVDPSGRREANIWKLIQMLQTEERLPGFRYLEFIHQRSQASMDSESSSGEADAVPVIEPRRVNLMTIHASKGLQFDHVIIPSLGKWRPRRSSELMMVNEDTNEVTFMIPHPEEGGMKASLLGEQIGEKRKARESEEYDRLLYVAMTRAKLGLTLIWSRCDRGSWADRLWKPLEEGIEDRGVYQAQRMPDLGEPLVNEKILHPIVAVRPQLSLVQTTERKVVSVTSLVEGKAKPSDEKKTKVDIQKSMEIVFQGVEAHSLFESLKYQPQAEPSSKDLQKGLHFVKNWNNKKLITIIDKGEVEWGFCLRHKEYEIQGQVDLWGFDPDGNCWVVDYKTGSEKYVQKAFLQLKIYAWALSKMNKSNGKPFKLAVIYPMTEKVYLEENLSLEEIERQIEQNLKD